MSDLSTKLKKTNSLDELTDAGWNWQSDADGNITGYSYDSTLTDASGTYSWSNHYDANWNLTQFRLHRQLGL